MAITVSMRETDTSLWRAAVLNSALDKWLESDNVLPDELAKVRHPFHSYHNLPARSLL